MLECAVGFLEAHNIVFCFFSQSSGGTSIFPVVSGSTRQNPAARVFQAQNAQPLRRKVAACKGCSLQRKKRRRPQNISFPSSNTLQHPWRTQIIAGAANTVLMVTAIQTRSEIRPPQEMDINTRIREAERERERKIVGVAGPENRKWRQRPQQKYVRLDDHIPARNTCCRQKLLQFFSGDAREFRFFVDFENMGATLHDNLENGQS